MLDALSTNEALGATVYPFRDKAVCGSGAQHTLGECSLA